MTSVAGLKEDTPKCEDCYFRKKMLCALDLEEPCVTFRPSRPEGLVPPKQPVLLLRPPRWASDPHRKVPERIGATLPEPGVVSPSTA
jgi:hypothetical protein